MLSRFSSRTRAASRLATGLIACSVVVVGADAGARAADPASGATAAPAPAATPENEEAARQRRVRTSFGFPEEVPLGQALTPKLGQVDRYSAPFTVTEAAEIEIRTALVRLDAPVVRRVAGAFGADALGGVFVDNVAGKLVVTLAQEVDGLEAALFDAVVHPDRLEIVRVARSLAQLRAIKEAIVDDATLAERGVVLVGVGPSERRNRVEVKVSSGLDSARQYFDNQYGVGATDVRLAEINGLGGATNIVDSPPYRAGLHLRNDGKVVMGDNPRCTSGFTGYRNSVPTTYFHIIAGHCGTQNDLFGQIFNYFGRINPRSFNTNSLADSARLPIPALGSNGQENRSRQVRLTTSSGFGYDTFDYRQGSTSDVEGQYVCQTGITTGYTCGELDNRDYAYEFADLFGGYGKFPHGRIASFDCNGGDSGGPIFFQGGAMGTLSAKEVIQFGNDYCIYGQIGDVLRAVDVHGLWQIG